MALGSFLGKLCTRVIRTPLHRSGVLFYHLTVDVAVVGLDIISEKSKKLAGWAMCRAQNHPRYSVSGKTPKQRGLCLRGWRGAEFNQSYLPTPKKLERTMDPGMTPDERVCATVVAELHHAMRHLMGVNGLSVTEILSVMHAEIVTQITSVFGGRVAAECCEAAAKRVAELPPKADFAADITSAVMQ